MKRIILMVVVGAGMLVPSAALVGEAGAANPHGPKGDPTASCGSSGGGKPSGLCQDQPLPQSQGCQHGQAPVQNPHCQQPSSSVTTTPTTTPTAGSAPAEQSRRVAGQTRSEDENQPAGAAAQAGSAAGGKLAFTGSETLWMSLLGAAMLASGLALRVRSRNSH